MDCCSKLFTTTCCKASSKNGKNETETEQNKDKCVGSKKHMFSSAYIHGCWYVCEDLGNYVHVYPNDIYAISIHYIG